MSTEPFCHPDRVQEVVEALRECIKDSFVAAKLSIEPEASYAANRYRNALAALAHFEVKPNEHS